MAAKDLPSNVEAEAKVVGAMFDYDDDNLALVLTHLGESSEPFFNPQHGIWYDAMVKMYRNGDRIRPESVKLYMEHMKIWESSGGMTMMSHLMSEATISEYIETYSKMILDCHSRRCLIQACKRAGAALYDANVPLEDIRATLESNVFKTASSALSNKWESAEDLVDVEFSRIESISEGKKGEGIRTGFETIDSLMLAMKPADYILLAACPSVGKTTLAMNIARNVAKEGHGVLIMSMEMTKSAIMNKLLGMEADVDLVSAERNMYLSESDRKRLNEAKTTIKGMNMMVDDESGLTPSKLRTKIKACMTKNKVNLIVIDYIGRLHIPKAESETVAITRISAEIKDIAKDLNVPILCLSQLNRKGAEERPRMSHLRQSGALEQDADTIILLSRCSNPEYILADIVKQRTGPTGEAVMYFQKQTQRFYDTDSHGDPIIDYSKYTSEQEPTQTYDNIENTYEENDELF